MAYDGDRAGIEVGSKEYAFSAKWDWWKVALSRLGKTLGDIGLRDGDITKGSRGLFNRGGSQIESSQRGGTLKPFSPWTLLKGGGMGEPFFPPFGGLWGGRESPPAESQWGETGGVFFFPPQKKEGRGERPPPDFGHHRRRRGGFHNHGNTPDNQGGPPAQYDTGGAP